MIEPLDSVFHEWLVALRRYFHQHPELSYREEKTAARIAAVIDELGVPFVTGIGKTGVVARLDTGRPGPVLALRADMDALPLEEMNDVEYRSGHRGVMHACGHDGHVTIALGVLRRLVDSGWLEQGRGRILFIFQPAEEGGAGAHAMLATGILNDEPIEAIFAGHLHPELPVDHVALAPCVSNAASDSIFIKLTGKGGHGAQPHLCIDPIVAGAHLVVQLQSIISRNVHPLDSAVLTIGRFQAGTAGNIIPEQAHLVGTLRTLDPEVKSLMLRRIEEVLEGVKATFRVSADLQVGNGYPVLVNDPDLVRWTRSEAAKVLGEGKVHVENPRMGAEDFAYFAARFPSTFIRLGCHDPEVGFVYGLHSPHFDFDERVLDTGVRLFSHLLTNYDAGGSGRTS